MQVCFLAVSGQLVARFKSVCLLQIMSRHLSRKWLTNEEREAIIRGRNLGMTQQQLAEQFHAGQSTVARILRHVEERGHVERGVPKGRPKKTSEKLDRTIIRLCRQDCRRSAVDITREMHDVYGANISVSTVKRRLSNAGLNGRRPVCKPLISEKNRRARLTFAREHLNWTPQQWSRVIWSDESKFLLFGTDGVTYVRRPVRTRYDVRYQKPSVKHGGGNVMLWGCFSARGVGPLHRIQGIMDRYVYQDILENILYPYARRIFRRNYIFQHDNDPKHSSQVVKQWFDRRRVHVMKWPSQSPDLNPIEHLWEELERRLRHRTAKNTNEKFDQLQKEWNSIPQSVLDKLLNSMPDRCKAVIAAKGYATKY